VEVPVPVLIVPPGDLVSVQVPIAGSPVSSTLPVAKTHVGWVIVPTTGGVGGVPTVNIVGAKPCSITTFVPVIVPTAASPNVQVNEPPVNVDFSPALATVCLLKVGCERAVTGTKMNAKGNNLSFIRFAFF
jgi:hypothetical protein